MKVKICGIKTVEDALMAIQNGADAIGFLVGQKYFSNTIIDGNGVTTELLLKNGIQVISSDELEEKKYEIELYIRT